MLISTKGMTRAQLDKITAILRDKDDRLELTEKPPTQYEYFTLGELWRKDERSQSGRPTTTLQRSNQTVA